MTPTEAAWHSACRTLLVLKQSEVVASIIENCPVPWIRRAFAAKGARPCIAMGVYKLMIGDQPWPALALSVGRREPGKPDRVAFALYTVMPDRTIDVMGRSKLDPARMVDPKKMPV